MIEIELFCIAELEKKRKYLGINKDGKIIVFYYNNLVTEMSYIKLQSICIDNKDNYELCYCKELLEIKRTDLPRLNITQDKVDELKSNFKDIDKINMNEIIPILLERFRELPSDEGTNFIHNILKIFKVDLDYILNNFKKGVIG
ncbi:hypothetical protein [uncultured Clostridium sp.]|uniref:hypothetical protein n=1 Tax=uncultured Clostridium sp. TaxID=59620 RepID=UPI0026F381A5|nr:hypothetical protein [uncultured Clostridium sp.]